MSISSIVVLLGFGVFSRYGFAYTPAFYEELAKFFLIWMTFAGGVVSMQEDNHVAIEMVVDMFKGKAALLLRLLIQILIFVTALLIFKYGLLYAKNGLLGVFTSMDWLSLSVSYVSVSFAYFSIALISLRNIIGIFQGVVNGK